jgi:hypothetical protein
MCQHSQHSPTQSNSQNVSTICTRTEVCSILLPLSSVLELREEVLSYFVTGTSKILHHSRGSKDNGHRNPFPV